MTERAAVRAAALPREHTSFVGRREQLAVARARLGTTRLLTITGPGGVGKTRFAIRLVDAVRRLFPDGAWFIDLAAVSPGGSVADETATQLGLPETGRDEEGDIARFFGEQRGVLVLDNCEHVLGGLIPVVRRILDDCPSMVVIATSRAALRVSAEEVFVLEPLAIPDRGRPVEASAVQLFLDRCADVLPQPSAEALADITEICRRLEGIPLAIELAATRVRALTPRQILERLDEPLTFLTRGDRDAPSRQRTLTAAIAWSYDLCTEAERELWRLMAAFPGAWDLAAAERLWAAPSARTLDTVQSLLEKSIVQRRESGDVVTYDMLESVRAYGLERSTPEQRESGRLALRDWCLESLAAIEAGWYGPDQRARLLLARRELPSIRAVLELCIRRGQAATAAALLVTAWRVVWQAHGRFDELGRWGRRVLELDAGETPELCQLLTLVGGVEVVQGEAESGFARLAQAEVVAARLGDAFTSAAVPAMRAAVGADSEVTIHDFELSLELQGGSDLHPARANVEEQLALAHDRLGHVETAAAMRAALVARAVRAGDRFETAYLLMNAGVNATARNELEGATSLLRQALSLTQELENLSGLAQVEEALASVAALDQDYTRAAMLLGAARSIWDAAGANAAEFPPLIRRRSEIEELSKRLLGPRAYGTAFRQGRSFGIDEGIAYALGAPLLKRPVSRGAGPATELSARESQVVSLVGQGLSDREIAEKLVISTRTAEGHVARSLAKLGFTSRAQLAAWTARGGQAD